MIFNELSEINDVNKNQSILRQRAPEFSNSYDYPVEVKNKSSLNEINFMDFSNFERAWKTAEMISKARCVPKEFWDNPADILVVVQFGHDIGLKPMVSIQNIMIINGRPSIWGHAMLAVCMKTKGLPNGFIDCIETYDEKTQSWTCTVMREGREPITRNFTLEEAKNGKLLEKPGAWQTSRKTMMQHKSRGPALRDMFPDLLKGIATIEEMQEIESQKAIETTKEMTNIVDSMKERLKNKLALSSSENIEEN